MALRCACSERDGTAVRGVTRSSGTDCRGRNVDVDQALVTVSIDDKAPLEDGHLLRSQRVQNLDLEAREEPGWERVGDIGAYEAAANVSFVRGVALPEVWIQGLCEEGGEPEHARVAIVMTEVEILEQLNYDADVLVVEELR